MEAASGGIPSGAAETGFSAGPEEQALREGDAAFLAYFEQPEMQSLRKAIVVFPVGYGRGDDIKKSRHLLIAPKGFDYVCDCHGSILFKLVEHCQQD